VKGQSSRWIKYFISAVISLIVLAYIFASIDWPTLYQLFTRFNWHWLILAWLVFIGNYFLRTLRFRALIVQAEHIPLSPLFAITSLHGMLNYILPARTGELSLPILLTRRLNVTLAASTVTLVAARFFDFLIIALLLPFILIIFPNLMPTPAIYGTLILCVAIYLVAVLLILWIRYHKEKNIFGLVPIFSKSKGAKFTEPIINALGKLTAELYKLYQKGRFGYICLLTIFIWLSVYTNFYFLILAMGFRLSYLHVVIVSIIMVPLTLLPLQGLANLGTHELGWVVGLTLVGYKLDEALLIAVGSHFILLIFVLVLGGSGFLISAGMNPANPVSAP
jgi:uncharacterized protein (TIRG00374 family)